MVPLVLKDDFGRPLLKWDEAVIHMKDTCSLLIQPDLTKLEI